MSPPGGHTLSLAMPSMPSCVGEESKGRPGPHHREKKTVADELLAYKHDILKI